MGGVTKTYHRLRSRYYWENMKEEVQTFIQHCLSELRKLTRVKLRQPMAITDTPGTAFEKVALDLVGPFPVTEEGNKWILTMKCLLTKFCIGVPLRDATAPSVADAFLKRWVCVYGASKSVLTDQGTNFLSTVMRSLAK